MTTTEAQVILGLAKNGLRIEPTARQLYMHRTTLTRLIRKIQFETRLDPLDFYDMQCLVPRAKTLLGMYGKFVINGGARND